MKRVCVLLILVMILIMGINGYADANKEPDVIKQVNAEFDENYYLLATPDCKIILRLNKRSKNMPIMDMSRCNSSFEERMKLSEKVLARIAWDTDALKAVKRYSFGGIEDSAELMYRLAAIVAKSPEWDRKIGRPKGKEIGTNRLIEKILNENSIFGELAEIFAEYHLKLKVYSVEKPLIFRVRESPIAEYAKNAKSAISPDDKLPMSATIVFAIEQE